MDDKPEITIRPLTECSVLIVGGTSGVGLATAIQFARAGVPRIGLVGRNAQRGEQARQAVLEQVPGTQVEFIAADANDLLQATHAAEQAKLRLGSVDILLNATIGLYTPELFHCTPIEDIQPIILQTVMAPLLMARLVLPWMRERKGGVIINIASDAAKVPTPGETVIGAAMGAIVMFSRTLALEAKRFGVRVNIITPSLIEGTETARRNQATGFSAKLFAKIVPMAHLGVAQPDDIAALIVFLSSPQAARITGQTISVTGGISAA